MQANRVQLTSAPRTAYGKKNKALRRQGWVPANISGRGPSAAIQLQTREIEAVLAHTSRNTMITVTVGDDEETVLIHGVARKPTTDALYHVDFLRVSTSETVRASVPIVFSGQAPAVQLYEAVVLHALNAIEVESLPQNLPTQIEVSLESLVEVDSAIHVSDLRVPAGVTILTDGTELVTKALAATVAEVEEAEPATAAPAAEQPPTPAAPEESQPAEA